MAPNYDLWMAHRYLINVLYAKTDSFNVEDERILKRCLEILRTKSTELTRHRLAKQAICNDYETTMPTMSICARCPVISASPDGSGYMCGLTLRAVQESAFNSVKAECLDTPKINPNKRTPQTFPNLSSSEQSPHYGSYGNV